MTKKEEHEKISDVLGCGIIHFMEEAIKVSKKTAKMYDKKAIINSQIPLMEKFLFDLKENRMSHMCSQFASLPEKDMKKILDGVE